MGKKFIPLLAIITTLVSSLLALEALPVYKLIVSVNSSKCMDIAGASKSNGGNTIQWDCHGGDNQQWTLEYRKSNRGAVPFVAIISKNSNMCLDVSGGGTANGSKVIQWPCHYGDNQLWEILMDADNHRIASLRSVHSGKCLDVSGVSRDNGAQIYIWDCHNGPNQKWYAKTWDPAAK